MSIRSLSVFTLLTLLVGISHPASGDELDQNGTLYSPYLEWSLVNTTYSGNPFDLIASATFTHYNSGETHTTQMFNDQANTWKFRFTATRIGTWKVITTSTDPDLDGKSGTIVVTANGNTEAHGFMKLFTDKWGWQGTETAYVPQYVMVSDNDQSLPTNFDSPAEVDSLINEYLVGHGFSGFHIAVLGGRWFDKDKATNTVDTDQTEPDPATFEALELLITKTHLAGGSVHIWPWGDASRRQTPHQLDGGINGWVDVRLQRYIAARLGPLPGWSMGYGFDLDEWAQKDQMQAWHDRMHSLIGWNHFLGGRHHNPNSGTDHTSTIGWNTGMDYNAYEHHKPTYEVLVAAMESQPDQPVFSEDRFRIRDEGRLKDYTAEETRRGLWYTYMAGGVAAIWGNLLSDASAPYPNKDQLKTIAVFFRDNHRFTPDMIRDNSLTDGVCLKRPTNQHFIFYKENTLSVEMDLSTLSGAQPAIAVDSKLAYAELSLGSYSPGIHTWTAPYSSDWAIAIGNFTSTSPDMDTDQDGLSDAFENHFCTDPADSDTDDDGISDGQEDLNHNGQVDTRETDPCQADSDNDGIQDGTESGLTLGDVGEDTDPAQFIPDADPSTTTNPRNDDTDRDGIADGEEDLNHNGRLDAGESNPADLPPLSPALKAAILISTQTESTE